jgi:hypothetical protein
MKDYSQADKAATKEFGTGEGRPIQKIEVNQPDAFPGDDVFFDNPRSKQKVNWCGKVVHLETHWRNSSSYTHYYTVKPWDRAYSVKVQSVERIINHSNQRL